MEKSLDVDEVGKFRSKHDSTEIRHSLQGRTECASYQQDRAKSGSVWLPLFTRMEVAGAVVDYLDGFSVDPPHNGALDVLPVQSALRSIVVMV